MITGGTILIGYGDLEVILDKLIGGVGLRRDRTNKTKLISGDALDCWRVLYLNKEEVKLLLFAEIKLPGEAWLEFKIVDDELIQTGTVRPQGLLGRLYWYSVVPLNAIIFNGIIKRLARGYIKFFLNHKPNVIMPAAVFSYTLNQKDDNFFLLPQRVF
mgnify:CR=1 FL=1